MQSLKGRHFPDDDLRITAAARQPGAVVRKSKVPYLAGMVVEFEHVFGGEAAPVTYMVRVERGWFRARVPQARPYLASFNLM